MTDAADISALTFEQALAELEKIVSELESGQAPLERSIEIYERGAALKAHCETRLEAARLRAGVRARLQSDPRRPAVHGRRRHPARPPDPAQGL